MTDTMHAPPDIEKVIDLGDGGHSQPPVEYRYIDGLPDNMLQYIGGPRDGGITPSTAEMTSFTQEQDGEEFVYHYRKGLAATGRIGYLYEGYDWASL